VNPSAAPVEAPKEIRPETGLERGVQNAVGGVEGGIAGGVAGGIVGGLAEAPPPPPPPPPPPAAVRVGGNIKPPTKTKDVRPVYPSIAQSARVQGVVIIEATIGPDGHVQEAKVLRSIALLDAAALDAVKQWVFTPTLLNGTPVPVIMTVTVNFTLQ
jgi:protein TonB